MIVRIRTKAFWSCVALAVGALALAAVNPWWLLPLVVLGPLVLLGSYDLTQRRHSLLRNFPIVGHLRFLLEDVGPELHQYMVENNRAGRPFDRDTRSLIYERSKNAPDKKAFGTELDVYATGYTWLRHSVATRPMPADPARTMRTTVGGPDCTQPYEASLLNVSAMSFGALGGAAIRAMGLGARTGGFAQDTGEGGISVHHRAHGADLVWQIGTGYFGCRDSDGGFDPAAFERQARDPQVKMIEIKVSQGAKPGHGGLLPGAKVTREIAEARLVPVGQDVHSPTGHSEFGTPLEMVDFVARLRRLSGGKPVGFKLCVGSPVELMAMVKAMLQTGIYPDFVVVDGAEGGTGAAPLEFSDSLGMPLFEGLMLVHNVLVGAGIRDRFRIGASAKLVTASAMAQAIALGADWCSTARGFMFSVGCLQSQRCHTNRCPTGVATQDTRLQRGLVVEDKAERVLRFHHNTLGALAEMVASMGLDHPAQLQPADIVKRVDQEQMMTFEEIYRPLSPSALLDGLAPPRFQRLWELADAERFHAERPPRYPTP